jgi:hypothetical protein
MRKVIKPYRLLDPSTHVYYNRYIKKKRLLKRYTAKDRPEMMKILKTICKHIAEGMIESPGGVYVKDIGYFFNWMPPRKNSYHLQIKGGKLEEHFNFHTDHYFIFPTYIPMAGILNPRSSWTMDKQFNHNITARCSQKIREGFQYRNYIHTLKTFQL